jgi:hypothetical protein
MQLFILLTGVLVFVFYLYVKPPIFFNQVALERLAQTEHAGELKQIQRDFDHNYRELQASRENFEVALQSDDPAKRALTREVFMNRLESDRELRGELKSLLLKNDPNFKVKDTNYVFLNFVTDYLPIGIVGLIIALIFSAAMSSTSSELNALATTTSVDFYTRLFKREATEEQRLKASKWLTIFWGIMAISFALVANLFDNLIEMVNVLGSLFYGTILGIFMVAFFLKKIGGKAVFPAALIAEAVVLVIHFGRVYQWPVISNYQVEYLWYNLIGCALVVLLASLFQGILNLKKA